MRSEILRQDCALEGFAPASVCPGFSLLELLVSLVLGSIMMLAAAQFTMLQVELQTVRTEVAAIQQKARLSLEILVGELRMAGYDPTGDTGAGISSATASAITFSADRNGDGDLQDSGEVLTFGLFDATDDGVTDLGLDQGNSYKVLASNVTGLALNYTLADGSETSEPSDLTAIRSVQISLTVSGDQSDRRLSGDDGLHYRTLSARTSLPNLSLE